MSAEPRGLKNGQTQDRGHRVRQTSRSALPKKSRQRRRRILDCEKADAPERDVRLLAASPGARRQGHCSPSAAETLHDRLCAVDVTWATTSNEHKMSDGGGGGASRRGAGGIYPKGR